MLPGQIGPWRMDLELSLAGIFSGDRRGSETKWPLNQP